MYSMSILYFLNCVSRNFVVAVYVNRREVSRVKYVNRTWRYTNSGSVNLQKSIKIWNLHRSIQSFSSFLTVLNSCRSCFTAFREHIKVGEILLFTLVYAPHQNRFPSPNLNHGSASTLPQPGRKGSRRPYFQRKTLFEVGIYLIRSLDADILCIGTVTLSAGENIAHIRQWRPRSQILRLRWSSKQRRRPGILGMQYY